METTVPAKKFLLPVGVGVVVFGAVTAFAASLTVNSSSLGAGNATVASCNSAASVTYAPVASGTGFQTGTATVTINPDTPSTTPCDGMAFKVTLLGASNTVLGTQSGTVSGNTGTASFTADPASVTGVAVVITG